MFDSFHLFTTLFFLAMAVAVLSALWLIRPCTSLNFVRIHIGIISIPPVTALLALLTNKTNGIMGPWRFDSLAWLLAAFVMTIGLIVQRYTVRYLLGDRSYRYYFALLTLTTTAASLTWLCNDLRLLLFFWAATLLGLTLLIGLNRNWRAARSAAVLTGRLFAISWLILLGAVLLTAHFTGHWQLSLAMAKDGLAGLSAGMRTVVNLLLVLAMMIPTAQWPFSRWLLDSAVAPTPVSAVMHAGLVNAGGIMLTRFAPIFSGEVAPIFLLILASISVLLGTGILLVQADYKRQLVGSTITQMGFMLIQCALGAYTAAIIHLILHGLFKATLFLQAGSAVHRYKKPSAAPSFLWRIAGVLVGIMAGVGYWLTAPSEGYQLISSFILGWSLAFAWMQLIALGRGKIERIAGLILLGGAAILFSILHHALSGLLVRTVHQSVQPPMPVVLLALFILMAGSAIGAWLARHRSSVSFAVVYLWLVRLGEPHSASVESHPDYSFKNISRGGK